MPVYLVIDAVDECSLENRRIEVLPCLKSLSCIGLNVHILLSSRPEADIRRSILGMNVQQIDLQDIESHVHGMGSYIAHVLTTDQDFSDWPRYLIDMARETLEQRANGM